MLSLTQQRLRLFSIVYPNFKNILRKGVEEMEKHKRKEGVQL